jgi:DHA1 family multidrug resistance protein-like MFS transporter
MGFSRLGLAFGGALGYAGGGWLLDTGKALHLPTLPWLVLAFIGIATFAGLWWQFSPVASRQRGIAPNP